MYGRLLVLVENLGRYKSFLFGSIIFREVKMLYFCARSDGVPHAPSGGVSHVPIDFLLMTLRFLSLFLFLTPTFLSLQAQAPAPADTTLLWRVEGPGLSVPSYVFGTIHMIPAEDYFLPTTVTDALAAAEQVAFEIDPRDMEDPSVLFKLMSQITMRNDTSLQDLLTEDEYGSVSDYFNEQGMPMMLFERMKPLFLSVMVGQDMGAVTKGGSPFGGNIKSYEMELTRIAERGDKAISGLETMEFQIGLFDSIPYRAQAQMLLDAINGVEETDGTSELDKMVDMYKRRAIAEMAALVSEEGSPIARFEELLLTRRNENWIAPMEALMRERPTFVAVGAAHLGGENGVIALLREAGYRVEGVY